MSRLKRKGEKMVKTARQLAELGGIKGDGSRKHKRKLKKYQKVNKQHSSELLDAYSKSPTKMVGQMSNMPPQPSNVMGVAKPVFDPSTMAAANNIYGNMQMRQNSVNAPNVFSTPFQQKIIGEQTFELEKDKPSGNYVAGLSLDGGSADPMDTSDRIVLTPEQKKKMEKNKVIMNNFIDQMEEMNIKKDSVSGGKNFYSIKK